jgi:hypothetical protein
MPLQAILNPEFAGGDISGQEYCAYHHYSGELRGSAKDCLIAMFSAYFDDSGTDGNSDIAIAACYVSTKRGWDEFVEAWDRARWEEGFEAFHMAHFVAKRDQGHNPFCDWDNAKKDHVYARLARIINENKRIGISVAIPKQLWDQSSEWIKQRYGREHYTFAVRMCMMHIREWRERSMISLPIRYVFDWEMNNTPKRNEITKLLDVIAAPHNAEVAQMLGVEPRGYSFEHKEEFKPLQAADILAWQMRSHMRQIWTLQHDEESKCHPGFRLLREDQEMDLEFCTEEQLDKFIKRNVELERQGHSLPILYP